MVVRDCLPGPRAQGHLDLLTNELMTLSSQRARVDETTTAPHSALGRISLAGAFIRAPQATGCFRLRKRQGKFSRLQILRF